MTNVRGNSVKTRQINTLYIIYLKTQECGSIKRMLKNLGTEQLSSKRSSRTNRNEKETYAVFVFFFNRCHPMQDSNATKIQGVTGCGRIRNRNIKN